MALEPDLSILIPTLESRRELFAGMMAALESQVARDGLADRVEILCQLDDGTMPIGTKRNRLMERARGRFLAFVDDDDELDAERVRRLVLCGCNTLMTDGAAAAEPLRMSATRFQALQSISTKTLKRERERV